MPYLRLWLPALLVLAAWTGSAAQPAKPARVAFLGMDSRMQAPFVAAFVDRLRALGYQEGRQVVFEFRWAERHFELLPALAAELVANRPDVIVTAAPPAVRAVQRATTSIPTVVLIHDPVGSGFVETLARPGRNITGVAFQDSELSAKRLDLLRQMIPRIGKVGVIWNREGGGVGAVQALEHAARTLGVELRAFEIVHPSDLPEAMRQAKLWGAQGIVQPASPVFTQNRVSLLEAAARHQLPMMCEMRNLVVEGCLATYSASFPAQYARMADYVDRVLRGARADSLPVEQPREFEFVINARTARELGLEINPAIRLRATEVLQ